MIDVTLTFDNYDLSPFLSTYGVSHEVEEVEKVTTMDGTEHCATTERPVITFSLLPMSDQQAASVYSVLSHLIGMVEYTNPSLGEVSAVFRVSSDINYVFGLRSVNGNRYYKGGNIVLRQRTVL